ncbi:uncharacterized protein LOC118509938 [Anopheles stephensi]|uniref:Shugoshin C-terminal domain-containing protein n=1 Tax=Anopheles stephensi TaxID=30069 RepID=A0A182YKZ8_ANOST|nr:uncharacterized protein LOC118509938 [Anopheles stephensi]
MELIADPAKVLTAYKIINQQLANEMQKKRAEIKLFEERYNATCEMLLCERQENKALRDMVRKLKDQMQIITNVIVSVQDQTVRVYDRINRPYEQAEALMQNYTPRAQQVFERRRTENPPYVDEDAIPEEEQEDVTSVEPELAANDGDDGGDEHTRPNESSGSNDEDVADDADKTFATNRSRADVRTSGGGGPLPMNSPLVQRLKRPSKNSSFDESFETIDRERAFKLSRHSQDRRQIYVNIEENISDLQSIGNSSKMDVDEQLSETLRHLSPVMMDDEDGNLSRASAGRDRDGVTNSSKHNNDCPRMSDRHRSQLKKTVSESVLSRIHRSNDDDDTDDTAEDGGATREVGEMTVFNPAELIASCSTPVAKGSSNERPSTSEDALVNNTTRDVPTTARRRIGRPRGRPRKASSETELHTLLNPVVVLQPLTEKNVKVHERKMQPSRKAKPIGSLKECDDSYNHHTSYDDSTFPCTVGGLEPCSSTENLSTMSGESSGRPRRRAAPKTLREPSLGTKLRRK